MKTPSHIASRCAKELEPWSETRKAIFKECSYVSATELQSAKETWTNESAAQRSAEEEFSSGAEDNEPDT